MDSKWEEVRVVGVSYEGEAYHLLTEELDELSVEATLWRGSLDDFASRLPLTLCLAMKGKKVEDMGDVFATEE